MKMCIEDLCIIFSKMINNPLNLPLIRETSGFFNPPFEKGDLGGC